MTEPVFVDTNVFIYALDDADLEKQRSARAWRQELWTSRKGRVSFQVLQEFYAKVIHKWPSSRDEARAEVRDLMAWRPVVITAELVELGWTIQDRYGFSFWDALIVAAAKVSSCRYLLTEDLQPGQTVEDVRIVNPFLTEPASLV